MKWSDKIVDYVLKVAVVILLVFWGFVAWRVFVADRFIIPSDSMYPTLQRGDRIAVNKLLYGARIYKDYDFQDGMELKSFRMKGLRNIRRNDILVFNFPINKGRISFKINYVYAKRCIGLPGDTVSIENGFYKVAGCSEPLGFLPAQEALSATPLDRMDEYVLKVMQPSDTACSWTIKDFGPLYIPSEGDTLYLDAAKRHLYSAILEYEGTRPSDSLHVFTHDYFFMAGDNVMDSKDSRYWGLLPDDYIVGIVKGILSSRDPYTGKRTFNRTRSL